MAKAKNATLVVTNSEQFCNDIWQYENEDFKIKEWKASIKGFAEVVQAAYDFLDQELYDEDGNEMEFGDDVLYQLGDVANMLRSIDIKIKKEV